MICPNCGEVANNNERFCRKCGTELQVNTLPDTVIYQPEIDGNPKSNTLKIVLIISAIICAVTVCVVAVMMLSKSPKSGWKNDESSYEQVLPEDDEDEEDESAFQYSDETNQEEYYDNYYTKKPDYYYTNSYYAIVNCTYDTTLNLRRGPDENYNIIFAIHNGERVTVIGRDEDDSTWVYIDFNGTYGWVSSKYIEIE